jgi:DNA-binding NtrC family response regulator
VSDIPLLVDHFVAKYARENNKTVVGISPDALAALMSYPWPGNVRELENMVERAVVMCNERIIDRQYFPILAGADNPDGCNTPPIPGSSLEEIEKFAIQKTLEAVGGNRTKAAEILKVSLRKIQYKLKEF